MTTESSNQPTVAVGVVRVSQTNDRGGDRFASPREQEARIIDLCARENLGLSEIFPEMNVSGSAPLEKRTGLLHAVEAVEAKDATVIVVAYFDRLVRSLATQADLLKRVEAAGGRVLTADVGDVSHGTAAQWLSATMHGAVAEYHNRITAEKTAAAQRRAVAEGRPPIILPPGLQRTESGVEIDPVAAPVVREAFRLRADGATIAAVRDFLASNGIKRSYHGTTTLLSSRLLVGEIVFGDLRGEVPSVVDAEVWHRAQAMRVPRGRKPKSDRLLARLGVLRCASCGARMVVGTVRDGSYPFYRCPPTGNCQNRPTISARLIEDLLVTQVRAILDGRQGTASDDTQVTAAAVALDAAQADLDRAVTTFAASGLGSEPAVVEQLTRLRETRDRARDEHRRSLAVHGVQATVRASEDWDELEVEDQRGLIAAVIDRVDVAPGRGTGRVTVVVAGS